MVHFLGHEFGVENHFLKGLAQPCGLVALALLGAAVARIDGQHVEWQLVVLVNKKVDGELRHKFVHAVMVVDAVAEPHLLQVQLQALEVGTRAVAGVAGVDLFQHLAHVQVVLAILVEKDVAALQGGLLKVINQLFLFQGQLVEPRHLVTKNLDVGKAVNVIVEIGVLCHNV